MSENSLYATWAVVVALFGSGTIYALHAGNARGDYNQNLANERAAQAAKLVEEHTQAERLACLNSERIWLEPQHLCLIPQGPK